MLKGSNISELQARPELLEIIDNVAKDKGISNEEVFEAMEMALKKVAAGKYGTLPDIRVKINRGNGAIITYKVLTVVEEVEDFYQQVSLEEAKKLKADVVVADEIMEELPPLDYLRGYAQAFRQVISSKVREAEKEREYLLYKDKVGEIVSGSVKRVEAGNVFIELTNKAEAFLRRDNTIPRENLEVGNRVRALITEVKKDPKYDQIILSRSNTEFIKKLFTQEIPEVYEGIIEIKSISRDAGSRSKVAVISNDPSIDPIGACIGFKGSKIQGVLSELKGEKIDLVRYSDNFANFVIQSFDPIEVLKVIVNEEENLAEVVVRDDKLSLAIGRRGQNINLITKLVGWKIDLLSESEEKEKREKHTQEKIDYFNKALDVDEVIARFLVLEGYYTAEDIAEDNGLGLKNISAFNDEIVEELVQRSKEYLKGVDADYQNRIKALGVSEDLIGFEDMSNEIILKLAENNIINLEDLADLSAYDLIDILSKEFMTEEKARDIILVARQQAWK